MSSRTFLFEEEKKLKDVEKELSHIIKEIKNLTQRRNELMELKDELNDKILLKQSNNHCIAKWDKNVKENVLNAVGTDQKHTSNLSNVSIDTYLKPNETMNNPDQKKSTLFNQYSPRINTVNLLDVKSEFQELRRLHGISKTNKSSNVAFYDKTFPWNCDFKYEKALELSLKGTANSLNSDSDNAVLCQFDKTDHNIQTCNNTSPVWPKVNISSNLAYQLENKLNMLCQSSEESKDGVYLSNPIIDVDKQSTNDVNDEDEWEMIEDKSLSNNLKSRQSGKGQKKSLLCRKGGKTRLKNKTNLNSKTEVDSNTGLKHVNVECIDAQKEMNRVEGNDLNNDCPLQRYGANDFADSIQEENIGCQFTRPTLNSRGSNSPRICNINDKSRNDQSQEPTEVNQATTIVQNIRQEIIYQFNSVVDPWANGRGALGQMDLDSCTEATLPNELHANPNDTVMCVLALEREQQNPRLNRTVHMASTSNVGENPTHQPYNAKSPGRNQVELRGQRIHPNKYITSKHIMATNVNGNSTGTGGRNQVSSKYGPGDNTRSDSYCKEAEKYSLLSFVRSSSQEAKEAKENNTVLELCKDRKSPKPQLYPDQTTLMNSIDKFIQGNQTSWDQDILACNSQESICKQSISLQNRRHKNRLPSANKSLLSITDLPPALDSVKACSLSQISITGQSTIEDEIPQLNTIGNLVPRRYSTKNKAPHRYSSGVSIDSSSTFSLALPAGFTTIKRNVDDEIKTQGKVHSVDEQTLDIIVPFSRKDTLNEPTLLNLANNAIPDVCFQDIPNNNLTVNKKTNVSNNNKKSHEDLTLKRISGAKFAQGDHLMDSCGSKYEEDKGIGNLNRMQQDNANGDEYISRKSNEEYTNDSHLPLYHTVNPVLLYRTDIASPQNTIARANISPNNGDWTTSGQPQSKIEETPYSDFVWELSDLKAELHSPKYLSALGRKKICAKNRLRGNGDCKCFGKEDNPVDGARVDIGTTMLCLNNRMVVDLKNNRGDLTKHNPTPRSSASPEIDASFYGCRKKSFLLEQFRYQETLIDQKYSRVLKKRQRSKKQLIKPGNDLERYKKVMDDNRNSSEILENDPRIYEKSLGNYKYCPLKKESNNDKNSGQEKLSCKNAVQNQYFSTDIKPKSCFSKELTIVNYENYDSDSSPPGSPRGKNKIQNPDLARLVNNEVLSVVIKDMGGEKNQLATSFISQLSNQNTPVQTSANKTVRDSKTSERDAKIKETEPNPGYAATTGCMDANQLLSDNEIDTLFKKQISEFNLMVQSKDNPLEAPKDSKNGDLDSSSKFKILFNRIKDLQSANDGKIDDSFGVMNENADVKTRCNQMKQAQEYYREISNCLKKNRVTNHLPVKVEESKTNGFVQHYDLLMKTIGKRMCQLSPVDKSRGRSASELKVMKGCNPNAWINPSSRSESTKDNHVEINRPVVRRFDTLIENRGRNTMFQSNSKNYSVKDKPLEINRSIVRRCNPYIPGNLVRNQIFELKNSENDSVTHKSIEIYRSLIKRFETYVPGNQGRTNMLESTNSEMTQHSTHGDYPDRIRIGASHEGKVGPTKSKKIPRAFGKIFKNKTAPVKPKPSVKTKSIATVTRNKKRNFWKTQKRKSDEKVRK